MLRYILRIFTGVVKERYIYSPAAHIASSSSNLARWAEDPICVSTQKILIVLCGYEN